MKKILKNLITYIVLSILLQVLFLDTIKTNNVFVFTITSILVLLINILVIFLINKKEIINMFKDYKKTWKVNLKKNIITWVIGFILMMVANLIVSVVVTSLPANEEIVRDLYSKYLVASLIGNIILGPILEEFVFRLGFNKINNKYIYILISSLIFALFHVIGSITNLISLIYILPYFVIGSIFTIVYQRSKNVFDSILIHSLHNFVVLSLYFVL